MLLKEFHIQILCTFTNHFSKWSIAARRKQMPFWKFVTISTFVDVVICCLLFGVCNLCAKNKYMCFFSLCVRYKSFGLLSFDGTKLHLRIVMFCRASCCRHVVAHLFFIRLVDIITNIYLYNVFILYSLILYLIL